MQLMDSRKLRLISERMRLISDKACTDDFMRFCGNL